MVVLFPDEPDITDLMVERLRAEGIAPWRQTKLIGQPASVVRRFLEGDSAIFISQPLYISTIPLSCFDEAPYR